MSGEDRIDLVTRLIERYNAQDADGYAAFFTDSGSEASYRGPVVREGKEGVREGLRKMFAEFPENRAEILESYALGEHVVLSERVWRSRATEPFDVMTVYSFSGDKVDRVEFIR